MKPRCSNRGRILALVGLVFGASLAAAQDAESRAVERRTDGPRSIAAESYGITNTDYMTVTAAEFRPIHPSYLYLIDFSNLMMTNTGGGNIFIAPVSMPSGALVIGLELAGCDLFTGDNMQVALGRVEEPNGLFENMAEVFTDGTASSPGDGCNFWLDASVVTPTIDNFTYSYYVLVAFGILTPPYTPDLKLRAVRLYWKRQVQPSDGTPAFGDVPIGNAYRQYVEAAAALGILSPCAPGFFCPDNPVTRAQLALALAKALGLDYPP